MLCKLAQDSKMQLKVAQDTKELSLVTGLFFSSSKYSQFFGGKKISLIHLGITLKQQQQETYLKISEVSNLNPIEKVGYNSAFCTIFTLQNELFPKG